MAAPAIGFAGFVYDDAGDGISGATIHIYDKNATTGAREASPVTSNSVGYWSYSHATMGEFDVEIVSGAAKRRIKFDDKVHVAGIDTQTLAVRGANSQPANMYLYADRGDAAGDAWKLSVADGGVVTLGNNIADIDAYVTHLTITPHATVASSIVTIPGILDVNGAVDIDATVQIDGTVTVGVDNTGYQVKFFGESAGAFMLYDDTNDQLEIRGPSADATTSTGKLLLSTALTDINANDVIGKIDFQAPLETGTDAIKVSASIQAVAQGTFAANVNATDLLFFTGHDNDAAERFRFTSQGEIGIGGANYGNDGQVLTSAGGGVAVAWEDAGSAFAITEYDMWYLSADTSTEDNTPLDTNLIRFAPNNAMFEFIGTANSGSGMVKSSGVFTFPVAGKWEVIAQAQYSTGSSTSNDNWALLQTSHDFTTGPTWQTIAIGSANGQEITATSPPILVDIVDLANDKVRLSTYGNGTLKGTNPSTAQPWFGTGIIFKLMGPTA